MKILVTAGGQGTKLWPYSRQNKPKQFQAIVGDASPYAEVIQSLLKKFQPEDIFISTKRKFISFISEQSPEIPLRNYIIEPDVSKDRGPGEGLAFTRLSVLHPDEPFFLVQADCIRTPEAEFLQMIEDAGKIVARDKKLLTGGMKALEPSIGVDYLRLGEKVKSGTKQEVHSVDAFLYRRKTVAETKKLIEGYNVVTHPQHYCWYPDLMLEAYKKYKPDWYEALMKMRDAFDQPGENTTIETIYAEMEKGPTEEVTRHLFDDDQVQVILLPFRWIDIGTWNSVYDFFEDGKANYEDGNVVTVDTKGSLVKTDSKNKLVAVAGVQDLVIVDTADVLLVVHKDQIDKIKDIQTTLEERNETEYL